MSKVGGAELGDAPKKTVDHMGSYETMRHAVGTNRGKCLAAVMLGLTTSVVMIGGRKNPAANGRLAVFQKHILMGVFILGPIQLGAVG